MIHLLIYCTKHFTKDSLLRGLEVVENELRQSREMTRTKIDFSALNIWPNLSRNTSGSWDFSSSSKAKKDRKIEGVTLLVKREKGGKKVFKCWTCDDYGHYAYKFLKREKKYNGNDKPRKVESVCMQMKIIILMNKH